MHFLNFAKRFNIAKLVYKALDGKNCNFCLSGKQREDIVVTTIDSDKFEPAPARSLSSIISLTHKASFVGECGESSRKIEARIFQLKQELTHYCVHRSIFRS